MGKRPGSLAKATSFEPAKTRTRRALGSPGPFLPRLPNRLRPQARPSTRLGATGAGMGLLPDGPAELPSSFPRRQLGSRALANRSRRGMGPAAAQRQLPSNLPKQGPEGRLALRVSASLAYQTARAYRLVRPRMARERVISSVYSRSLPTGMPWAMRLTRSPKGLSSRAM